jgi:feruloyl esterase
MPLTCPRSLARGLTTATALFVLLGCASTTPSRAPAQPARAAQSCESLSAQFEHPQTRLLSTERVAAGQLKLPGIAEAMPEHCVVKGRMNERVSPMDGKSYAISFEMRLPTDWNGRFFYQANGGLDGFVTPAYGDILGGGPKSNGLLKGYAVISSDAGHAFDRSTPIGGALFGVDPQARLDYGYNAVAQLTPMAKALIRRYYGKGPDRSYLVGTSNGGRHGMVAAARLPDAYDGILVSTPGYNLPRAAVAQVWGAQQFATVSRINPTSLRPELRSAFSAADLSFVAQRVLARCDALDGIADGWVADLQQCQREFDLSRDVPSCPDNASAANAGQCLSAAQKQVLARVMAGPVDAQGRRIYTGLAWDPGLAGKDWASWKFDYSVGPRDAIALAFVMSTPPASPQVVNGQGNSLIDYALTYPIQDAEARINATNATYSQSALQFMTPPDVTFQDFVNRGGRIVVLHGSADPVFSVQDTAQWYDRFTKTHRQRAAQHARFYIVPGMNHSRGGPATDQFDMLEPLVNWVERDVAPEAVVASARGADSPVPNPEVPREWSPARTRLLCPYPQVARYSGRGDSESAGSFRCAP